MALDLSSTRVAVPEQVLTRVVDGTTVVLDVETGRSYTLDAIGTRVWELVTSLPSAQTAVDVLVSEYRAERTQIQADVTTMLEQLAEQQLVRIEVASASDNAS